MMGSRLAAAGVAALLREVKLFLDLNICKNEVTKYVFTKTFTKNLG